MARKDEVAASRITVDVRNTLVSAVGAANGVDSAMIDALAPTIAAQHQRITSEHDESGQRWMDLPADTDLVESLNAFALEVRERYSNFILIGIGGSSLGAIATIQALTHPFRNLQTADVRQGPRFFVLDNPDPGESGRDPEHGRSS